MLQYEELRLAVLENEKPLQELREALGLDTMKEEVAKLEAEAAKDGFWDDVENSQKVLKETSRLKAKIAKYEKLESLYEDTLVMIELADEEEDESLYDECKESADQVKSELEAMTLSTLLSGEYDESNALLTFHAGAGGTEAQDWASMLFRMYNRWGERHGFKVKTLDYLDGDEAGLKSATILIEGENAYGYMKSEAGVHRLVRVSPFDSQAVSPPSTPRDVVTRPSRPSKSCPRSTTASKSTCGRKTSRWKCTARPAPAARRSTRPPLPSVSSTSPRASWSAARSSVPSTRTEKSVCAC